MKEIKRQKGMVLITILLLSVLLTMMTVSMVFISSNHLNLMGNVEQKIKALKAAEAAAEYALTELNRDPTWGMWDPLKVTPVTTDDNPDPVSNITINLNGAKATLIFERGPYMSYNNLKFDDAMSRTSIGDTKLAGNIPAYTAEFICKGETDQGIVKYLKVIFIRNDIYPYPINSDGQIKFANAGDSYVFGDVTTNCPGYIHSNWEGTGTSTDADYYSIKTGGDEDDFEDPNIVIHYYDSCGNLDLNGGIAAAVDEINVKADPNKTIKAINPDGKEEFEDFDVDTMLSSIKDSFPQADKVDPGTVLFTPRYYIVPSGNYLLEGDPTSDTNYIIALGKGIEDRGGSFDADNYLPGLISSLRSSGEPGLPPETPEDAAPGFANPRWVKPPSAPADYGWLQITNVATSEPYYDGEGNVEGYDNLKATHYYIKADWTVEGEVWKEVPVGSGNFEWVTEQTSDNWEHDGDISEVGDFSFSIKDNNKYWGNNRPCDPVLCCCKYDIAVAKLDEFGDLEKIVEPGESAGLIGMDMSLEINGNQLEAELALKKDIYITNIDANTPPTLPGSEDFKEPLQKFYYNYDVDNPSDIDIDPNIFCISGVKVPVSYGSRAITMEDFRAGTCPHINRGDLTPEITLNLSPDGNPHNIYSDAHIALGAEVQGEGMMISRGKLGYICGVNGDDVIAIANDDLILATKQEDYIEVTGLFYSDDDLQLIPVGDSALSTGSSMRGFEINKQIELVSGDYVIFTENTDDPNSNIINVNMAYTGDGLKYCLQNFTLNYNGSTALDCTDYQLQINMTTFETEVYELDISVNPPKWVEVTPLPTGFPSQGELNNIGRIIGYNFDYQVGTSIKINGNLVGLNKHTRSEEDSGHNSSIHIYGEGSTSIYYKMVNIGKLALLRGDDFTVRRASWCEL